MKERFGKGNIEKLTERKRERERHGNGTRRSEKEEWRERERERVISVSIYRSSTTGWDNCVGGEVAIAHATGGEGSHPPPAAAAAANRGLGRRNGRVHTRVRCIYVSRRGKSRDDVNDPRSRRSSSFSTSMPRDVHRHRRLAATHKRLRLVISLFTRRINRGLCKEFNYELRV